MDGVEEKRGFQMKSGQIIRVRRRGGIVEWVRDGRVLCAVRVPGEMEGKGLRPVCWIWSSSSREYISRLRFV